MFILTSFFFFFYVFIYIQIFLYLLYYYSTLTTANTFTIPVVTPKALPTTIASPGTATYTSTLVSSAL